MAENSKDLRCYQTFAGIAAENNAIQLGRSLNVVEMVFGSGELPDASDPREQTSLIKEELAVPCAMMTDADNKTLLVFKGDIPADVGGFYIHEVAIRLDDGSLYGYARGKGDWKPTLEQGSTESVRYAVEMYTTNADIINVKVDLSTVYADYEDLENALDEHKKEENPHDQYPLSSNAQFLPFDPERIYSTGEVCYTKDDMTGEISFWQWYSNIESLSGKDPVSEQNRQQGWIDDTKPFYWTPYKKTRAGTPLWPWMSMTFPEGTLNVVGNSVPVAVFWRLAQAFPEFVNAETNMIDFPETGGEFFRVLDQGRGKDSGRQFGSAQNHALQKHNHALPTGSGTSGNDMWGIVDAYWMKTQGENFTPVGGELAVTSDRGHSIPLSQAGNYSPVETRPRNLAFPILVEV